MPRIRTIASTIACAGFALLGSSLAAADDDNYMNSVRLGSYSVFYHVHADDVSGPYVPPGVNIHAENLETLYGAYVRSLPYDFQVELAMGWPPLAKTKGVGPAELGSVPYNGQVVSEVRWFAPAILLEYNFLPKSSPLRPYVGVGANYVSFYDRTVTPAGQAAFGGPTRLSLTSSLGPAATVGVDWHIARRWHFYASYSASQVKSDLHADTDGIIRVTRVSFRPQALILAGGFSF
ncbi:MAG TPA: OmpW family outer membrane protein [Steroidobacteraceae bacterium]|nr:OmpW family outer membrane protein [Steroidobacteraceae bacterium]